MVPPKNAQNSMSKRYSYGVLRFLGDPIHDPNSLLKLEAQPCVVAQPCSQHIPAFSPNESQGVPTSWGLAEAATLSWTFSR